MIVCEIVKRPPNGSECGVIVGETSMRHRDALHELAKFAPVDKFVKFGDRIVGYDGMLYSIEKQVY